MPFWLRPNENHVLSQEAQAETRLLMLAAQNILNPKDGKPVVTPSQDYVLGNYYFNNGTRPCWWRYVLQRHGRSNLAYNNGYVRHTAVLRFLRKAHFHINHLQSGKERMMATTVGKLIINEIMPLTKWFQILENEAGHTR